MRTPDRPISTADSRSSRFALRQRLNDLGGLRCRYRRGVHAHLLGQRTWDDQRDGAVLMTGAIGVTVGSGVCPAAWRQRPASRSHGITRSTTGTATASISIASDGKVRNSISAILESWLLSGVASDYEVRATLLSGTLDRICYWTWLGCGTSRTWSRSNSAHNDSTAHLSVYGRDQERILSHRSGNRDHHPERGKPL
jgi:hypothetical protein